MLRTNFPGKTTRVLLIIFSIIATVIAVTGILIYKGLESKTRLEAHNELAALANVKIREVINWRQERIKDAYFIYNNDQFKRLALNYLTHLKGKQPKQMVTEFIRSIKNNHEYTDILIIDSTSRKHSLFIDGEQKLLDQDKECFMNSIKERRVILSDINKHKSESDSRIHMSSFIPISLTNNAKVFCVVEIRMDPSKILFPAIQMSTDNNQTSETFIVRKEGNDVLFLNNLRYQSNAALNFRQPLTNKELPSVMAVLGKEGIYEGVDYRGVRVLADLQKIPDSPWFIISKIDQDELYAPVKVESALVTSFVVILILLCGIAVYAIWKHQQLKFLEQGIKSELDREILQERIDFLVKNANDVILLLDENNNIVQVNDKALMVYGFTSEEFRSLTITDLRAESTREEIENDKNRIKEHNGYIFETVHVKKDGTEFPVEVSSRIVGVNGHNYYQSIIRDVTERKSYQKKLESTITELNRSNRDLEQFAYVASHDLQEPLRMVHTYAQLLERKYDNKLDGNAHKYISFLTEGAHRMQQLIQALLEYSRINSSTKTLEEVDLNKVIESALENLGHQIKQSHAVITYHTLPTLTTDYSQMVQLFQNLISNSLKYRSKENPEIAICVENNAGELLFSVKDNGIGIKSEYFEKIFVIFQRLHERDKYEGTGIGLNICKKIVEHLGGRIWVESEEGKGATFFFTIPANIE